MKKSIIFPLLILITSCQHSIQETKDAENVITSDINLFWKAYDQIVQEPDSSKKVRLLDSLYISKGSAGLAKIIEARNYTAVEYVDLINSYPKFWQSIRENTFKSKSLAKELNNGLNKLEKIYPEMNPAKIFFTIGAMRTNGTTRDSSVLIGSELAMADSSIDISEFEGRTKEWLENFFGLNPIEGLVLLNVHEYVHTQQNPIPTNLLHICLYEGVAEFVSVIAMGVPSNTPAVAYGKENPAVRAKFEREMFYERTYDWLWSNSPNEFNVRDLGYYIGYAIAEIFYDRADDKLDAIKTLIEIDYAQGLKVDSFIDDTRFFTKPISTLRKEDQSKRPKVSRLNPFNNGDTTVDSETKLITIEFSEPLNGHNTGVDYGPLGESGFPKIISRQWSNDGKSWNIEVELEANKHYQFYISNNFRTEEGIPLLPYLIDFKTKP